MSDYTPVPEADLEASFMETLALLRQNSTDGHAALSGLQRLTEQLTSEAHRRELEHKNVMAMLNVANETIKEANSIIANSRPIKQTSLELAKEVSTILFLGSCFVLCFICAIFISARVLIYFNWI